MTTTSPTFTMRTSAPMASTTPMASCPMWRPVSLCSIVLYGQRSLPQMAARATATRASAGSIRWGSDCLDADVAGAVDDGCTHRHLPRVSSELELVEPERRRQLPVGLDLLLKV